VSVWIQAWAIISWWVGLSLLGCVTYPLLARLFRHLPDSGFALSKVVGLLFLSYAIWLTASVGLLPFTTVSLLVLVALFVLLYLTLPFFLRRPRPALSRSRATSPSDVPLPLLSRWRKVRRPILEIEALTLAAYLVCLGIRMYNPEIIGAEKFMDFSFLNALGRAQTFPPHDPWLSGATLNYYYFGYLMTAVFTKLLALPARLTYNISVAFIFAVLVGAAYSLVWSITGRRRYGLAAVLFVAVAGNLDGIYQLLGGSGIAGFDFWRSTRVIEGTINEFPYFTVLFADLHPHLLALPLVVVVIHLLHLLARPRQIPLPAGGGRCGPSDATSRAGDAVTGEGAPGRVEGRGGLAEDRAESAGDRARHESARAGDNSGFMAADWTEDDAAEDAEYGAADRADDPGAEDAEHRSSAGSGHAAGDKVRGRPGNPGARAKSGRESRVWLLGALALLTLLLGALNVANFWDFPSYILLSGIFLLAGMAQRYHGTSWNSWIPTLVRSVLMVAVVTAVALLLFLPFYLSFHPHMKGVGMVERRTPLSDMVTIFAIPLFLAGSYLIAGIARIVRSLSRFSGELLLYAVAAFIIMAYAGLASWGASIVATILALVVVVLAVGKRRSWGDLQTLLFMGSGFLLVFIAELFHLEDSYGEDLERMNTVFKLHFQAWVVLGLGSALALWRLEQEILPRMRRVGRRTWYTAFVMLVLAVLVYPVVATYVKCGRFRVRPTLDGMAYIAVQHPGDYGAIEWLNERVPGAPTIVEAAGPPYSYYARFSTNTGLPAVLGWGNHELLWRNEAGLVGEREDDIRLLYEIGDPERAQEIVEKYGVAYICLGEVERAAYDVNAGHWAEIWPVVFEREGCRIFSASGERGTEVIAGQGGR